MPERAAAVTLVHPREIIAGALLVLALGSAAGLSLLVLARWCAGGSHSPGLLDSRGARAGALAVLAALAAGWVWARFIEPRLLATTRLAVPGAKPRPRLVFVSDLHVEGSWHLREALVERVRALAPEAILLGGDYLNDRGERSRETLARIARGLSEIAPAVAALGNADAAFPDLRALLESCGVRVLGGGSPAELPGGAVVWGVDFVDEAGLAAAASRLDRSRFNILLTHEPSLFPAAARAGFDLCLAGHTHGGQVRLPVYGAVVTLAVLGKRFEAGAYELGGATCYVTRGVGLEGGTLVPRVRFLCRPEVVVVEGSGWTVPAAVP